MESKKLEKPRENGTFSTVRGVMKPDEEGRRVFPTMKPLDNEAPKAAAPAPAATPAAPVEIDLSKVEIEPLFQDMVDFETFSKSDFRVVKIKACEAVKKSKKLLKFPLEEREKERTGLERKSGVDFLRMFLMFLVPILHILGNGGVLANTPWMSSQYLAGWLLETVALCAVDCFALISGYVGSTAKFRWSRVGNLWLGIVFYTLLLTALFAVWMPEVVSRRTWFGAIFPITSNQYWFMTAYVGMFFFIPLMNLMLEKASKRMLTEFLVAVLVVFSFLPCLFTILLQDSPYGLHRGYSMVWLIMLYLVGGYLRKYEIPQKLSRKKAVVVFCISTLLAWLSKVVIEWGTNRMLGYPAGGTSFVSYVSPFIVINAVALLCFFARTEFRSKALRKGIAVLSPAALGVYIIHVHPLVWNYVLRDCLTFAAAYPVWRMLLWVVALAFGIYLICSLIDVVRIRLFQAVGVPVLCRKLDGWIAGIHRESPLPPEEK